MSYCPVRRRTVRRRPPRGPDERHFTRSRCAPTATVDCVAMDTKVADPLHGALIGGRYRIMGRLAKGGMATVYQARDERLERAVALKIINHDHAREQAYLDRLSDEAKTVARLAHPN